MHSTHFRFKFNDSNFLINVTGGASHDVLLGTPPIFGCVGSVLVYAHTLGHKILILPFHHLARNM